MMIHFNAQREFPRCSEGLGQALQFRQYQIGIAPRQPPPCTGQSTGQWRAIEIIAARDHTQVNTLRPGERMQNPRIELPLVLVNSLN